MKVSPLVGDYCPCCAETLATGKWKEGSIIPLCRECLDEMISVGDLARASEHVISTLTAERDALRERVERLEKEAEAGKQLNRDMLSCIEADMREDFDMDEMVEAVERYEKVVFPLSIPAGESKRDLKDLTPLDKIQGIWKDKPSGEK